MGEELYEATIFVAGQEVGRVTSTKPGFDRMREDARTYQAPVTLEIKGRVAWEMSATNVVEVYPRLTRIGQGNRADRRKHTHGRGGGSYGR